MKGQQAAEKRRFGFRRHGALAGDPCEDLLVRHIEERLEAGEFELVKFVKGRIGKSPKEQVDFPHAAVPRTETQAFAAHIEFLAPGFRLACHRLSTIEDRRRAFPTRRFRAFI